MYNVVDLFAGAGGLSLGFQQTHRYCIKAAFEHNPAMQATYRRNHPNTVVYGDVRCADYAVLQEELGPIDVVIGGPPCQGFSNANRQKNTAVSQNNALVKEYIRAVLEIRPKAFVMENVSMLKSDVHRFFLSQQDLPLLESAALKVQDSYIRLLDSEYMFAGAAELIQNPAAVQLLLWPKEDYQLLNVIYKAAKSSTKLSAALKKHKKNLLKTVSRYAEMGGGRIEAAGRQAFISLREYYEGRLTEDELRDRIAPAVMYQRMLQQAAEIAANNLVVDEYSLKDGLRVKIRSFSVYDYLKERLDNSLGALGYKIEARVLSAADYGAPQKRMRFVIMGLRKDIPDEVQFPLPQYDPSSYRTVRDAISDLEETAPVFDVLDDAGRPISAASQTGGLNNELRDSDLLRNHIITRTRKTSMDRFKALKQGENFHALDQSLMMNTYTDPSRTQNTIYLRLDYDQPCGTVVNVRKSMWVHPVLDRALSIREAARLQTFPDSFVFMGTKDQQYQQVGNAVPPIMARTVAECLAEQLDKIDGAHS